MFSGNTLLIKEVNKNLVRESLRILRKATKQELSVRTGLSVVTIHSLLSDLIAKEEVLEGEMIPSNGGRPSVVYYYNENHRNALILYGHQKENRNFIRMIVTNLVGECVYEEESYEDEIRVETFDKFLNRAIVKYPNVSIIGFGLPGEEEDGIITFNDYEQIVGREFMNYYRVKYQMPVIFVNDINAAVNGYYQYKSSSAAKNVVGIYFPRIYKPGAGIIIDGEIYTGTNSFAGEIGNLPMGVDWVKLNYYKKNELVEAVSKLLATITCVIAPEEFVLYGDFWSTNIGELIKLNAERLLRKQTEVNIVVSDKFEDDLKEGMIRYILEQMESKYIITRKGI